jgi:hypothetical protein
MAGRGETIGEAFIRILADGSKLHKSIEDEFSKGDFQKAGQVAGKDYQKGFEQGLKEKPAMDKLEKAFEKERGRIEAIGSHTGQDFEKGLSKQFKDSDIGRRLAEELDKGLLAGTVNAENTLDDFAHKALPKVLNDIHKEEIASANRITAESKRIYDAYNKSLVASRLTATKEMGKVVESAVAADIKRMDAFRAESQKIEEGLRLVTSRAATARDAIHHMTDEIDKVRKNRSTFSNWAHDLESTGKKLDLLGDKVGKAFGKGSRNNFFNIFGSVIGVIADLPRFMTQAVGAIVTQVGKLQDAFNAAGGGIRGFLSVGAKLGTSVAGGVAGLGALVVVAALVITAISPLIALVSGLAAAFVALTASVSIGLIGALGAVAPLLLGAVAGIAVFAVGLSQLKSATKAHTKELNTANAEVAKWQKQLATATPGTAAYAKATAGLAKAQKDQAQAQKDANAGISGMIAPLKEWFKTTSLIVAQHLFADVPAAVANAKPSLGIIKDIMVGIADAISHTILAFSNLVKSPGFQAFLKQLKTDLPVIVGNLGSLFVSLISIVTGVFRVLLPIGKKFSDSLAGAADGLAKLVNTPAKQKGLSDFFNNAWDDAKKLWGIIKDIGSIIGTVFASGDKKAGKGFLDGIQASFDQFAAFLRSPRGQQALSDWFKKGKEVIQGLGPIIQDIQKLFNALNTQQAQDDLKKFLRVTNDVLTIITVLVKFAPAISSAFNPVFNFLVSGIDFVAKHMEAWKLGTMTAIATLIGGFRNFLTVVIGVFGGIVHAAATAFGWVPGIGGKLRDADKAFQDFARSVNASLDSIQKDIQLSVHVENTQNIIDSLSNIKNLIDYIRNNGHVDIGVSGRGTAGLRAGGWVTGPGTSTSDSVPIRASDGEFVTKASSASQFGQMLEAINSGNRSLIAAAARKALGNTAVATAPSKTVNVVQNIQPATADPRAVANEVLALAIAQTY